MFMLIHTFRQKQSCI